MLSEFKQIRVVVFYCGKDFAEIFEGERNGFEEMGFALEITSIAISAKYLECAEKNEMG
jgi:hypothetical protein